jgi:transcriptional regulator with XRE-family HTH domain
LFYNDLRKQQRRVVDMSKNEVKKKRCILKRLMAEKKYTQTALSELSGVPQTVISRYARGSSSYDASYLFALAEALELESIENLFEDEE